MLKIVDLMLSEFSSEIKDKNITLKFTDEVKEYIIKKGFDPKFGARPLRRAIEKNIEDIIAVKYIKGEVKENNSYLIDFENNEIVIK